MSMRDVQTTVIGLPRHFAILPFCLAVFASPVLADGPEQSCGKRGWWEGVSNEVLFSNRLGKVLPTFIKVPTQEWKVTLGTRNEGKVGQAVCNGNENALRWGLVKNEFILAPSATNKIEASSIWEECTAKRRELEKLPPDKQALIDEKKRQTREILGNKGAMATLTPEEQKARTDSIVFQNRIQSEHEDNVRAQTSALTKECNAKRDPLVKDVRYHVYIQINASGTARNDNATRPLFDLGDKTIKNGPNDKVRRVQVYATPTAGGAQFNANRVDADLTAIKDFIDHARLQAMITNGGMLPSDEELAPVKAEQQAALKEFEKWEREQSRLVSQAERDRRGKR